MNLKYKTTKKHMKNLLINILKIILALIITSLIVIYQKSTGPTYPKKFNFYYKNILIKAKLYRSYESGKNCPITISVPPNIKGVLLYKLYPSSQDSEWIQVPMKNTIGYNNTNIISAELPFQPPAGKLQYFVNLFDNNTFNKSLGDKDNPIIIRFKGSVPLYILIPHILFMFLAFFFIALCLIESIAKWKTYHNNINYQLILITIVCIFIGGLILGPIVQKFAFGEYWTGFPYGKDLTDNKTLIMFIIWVITYGLIKLKYLKILKTHNPKIVFLASILTITIYLIPHSMWGSQLDHKTGQIITGKPQK